MLKMVGALILLGCMQSGIAKSALPPYFVCDESRRMIFTCAGDLQAGDEYIDKDNRRFIITAVDGEQRRAAAEFVENVLLPRAEGNQPVWARSLPQSVGLYPADFGQGYLNGGGLPDVIEELKMQLAARDIGVFCGGDKRSVYDNNLAALFAVGREVSLDPSEYAVTLGGRRIAGVRIELDGDDPNLELNEALAQRLKQASDSAYPGLIRDILIRKSVSDQDGYPREITLLVGSDLSETREAVLSQNYLADVIRVTLLGGKLEGMLTAGQALRIEAGDGQKSLLAGRIFGALLLWGLVACLFFRRK